LNKHKIIVFGLGSSTNSLWSLDPQKSKCLGIFTNFCNRPIVKRSPQYQTPKCYFYYGQNAPWRSPRHGSKIRIFPPSFVLTVVIYLVTPSRILLLIYLWRMIICAHDKKINIEIMFCNFIWFYFWCIKFFSLLNTKFPYKNILSYIFRVQVNMTLYFLLIHMQWGVVGENVKIYNTRWYLLGKHTNKIKIIIKQICQIT
jgi:hypothetical protein